MNQTASIIEIFSSIQGEGPHIGERHTFVRFQDCELSCSFCDTPQTFVANLTCRVEEEPFSKKFVRHPNPISVPQLNQILSTFQDRTISITGGEPLQKPLFLQEWLPTLKTRVLLETAGVHVAELKSIIDWVDIVSMDFKLPSVTGMKPYWDEHVAFLKIAQTKEVYVKIVVSSDTSEEDLQTTLEVIDSINAELPVILQPTTAFAQYRKDPSLENLIAWQSFFLKRLRNVRILPQLHRQWGLL